MCLEALKEFRHFPGSILMTSNCLMPPMGTFEQTEKSRRGQQAAFKPNEAFEGLRFIGFRSRAVHRASQSQMEENRVESSHEASIGSCWDPLGAKPQPTSAQALKPKSQHPAALSPKPLASGCLELPKDLSARAHTLSPIRQVQGSNLDNGTRGLRCCAKRGQRRLYSNSANSLWDRYGLTVSASPPKKKPTTNT